MSAVAKALPPPPTQPPVLDAVLATAPSPPAQPPALMMPSLCTSPLQAPIPPAGMPSFPPPPLRPPVLDAKAHEACTLPPPPCTSAFIAPALLSTNFSGLLQPPPSQAPSLCMAMQTQVIPPPPLQEAVVGADLECLDLPSLGSADHVLGTCRPCAFYHSKGCSNGERCIYCDANLLQPAANIADMAAECARVAATDSAAVPVDAQDGNR